MIRDATMTVQNHQLGVTCDLLTLILSPANESVFSVRPPESTEMKPSAVRKVTTPEMDLCDCICPIRMLTLDNQIQQDAA